MKKKLNKEQKLALWKKKKQNQNKSKAIIPKEKDVFAKVCNTSKERYDWLEQQSIKRITEIQKIKIKQLRYCPICKSRTVWFNMLEYPKIMKITTKLIKAEQKQMKAELKEKNKREGFEGFN